MDEKRLREQVHYALDSHTTSFTADPHRVQRILNAAHRAKGTGGIVMKQKLSIGFVLMMIVLLSSFVALACSHSYVIQYVFGKNMDSDEAQLAEAKVQPIDFVHHGDTTVCTVKDAYCDGETLAIGVGFQTDRPLYIVSEEVKLNGEWIDWVEVTSSMEEKFLGNIASPQRFPVMERITGIKYRLARALPKGEEIDVWLQITLLTPKNGVEEVDIWQEDKQAMWAEIDAIRNRGLTPISAPGPHNEWHQALISLGHSNSNSNYHGPLCDVDALVQHANMEVIETVELTFTLTVQ